MVADVGMVPIFKQTRPPTVMSHPRDGGTGLGRPLPAGTPYGEPIPILLEPVNMADGDPSGEEIKWSLRIICPNRIRCSSGMQLEHLKIRLASARSEENPDPSKWHIFMDMTQFGFETGELAT